MKYATYSVRCKQGEVGYKKTKIKDKISIVVIIPDGIKLKRNKIAITQRKNKQTAAISSPKYFASSIQVTGNQTIFDISFAISNTSFIFHLLSFYIW